MNHAYGHVNTHAVYTQTERYDVCTHYNLHSWRTLLCDENHDKTLNTHTHTLGPAELRSIPVSDKKLWLRKFCHTHHWLILSEPISKWLMLFFFLLQHEIKEEQCRIQWLKGGKMLNVWEEERDQTTYYSDVSLLTVRQTGERCHMRWTNRRQRNGATYDINAGMGWELPAWGSFPMSRQTAWAHSDTALQKHNPHIFCFIIHVGLILHQCFSFAHMLDVY